MTDEEAEIIRCNRYFDIVDTVLGKINRGFEKSETVVLAKEDWEIISEHMRSLGSIFRDYNLLRESMGI
jgi:hypothetical protein